MNSSACKKNIGMFQNCMNLLSVSDVLVGMRVCMHCVDSVRY